MDHWLKVALIVAAVAGIYVVVVAVAAAGAGLGWRVWIMMSAACGWKDAGAMMRYRARRKAGWEPGVHRAETAPAALPPELEPPLREMVLAATDFETVALGRVSGPDEEYGDGG
jgi:hypothetical protein